MRRMMSDNTVVLSAWNRKIHTNPMLGGALQIPTDDWCFEDKVVSTLRRSIHSLRNIEKQTITNCRNCGSSHPREMRKGVLVCAYCGSVV